MSSLTPTVFGCVDGMRSAMVCMTCLFTGDRRAGPSEGPQDPGAPSLTPYQRFVQGHQSQGTRPGARRGMCCALVLLLTPRTLTMLQDPQFTEEDADAERARRVGLAVLVVDVNVVVHQAAVFNNHHNRRGSWRTSNPSSGAGTSTSATSTSATATSLLGRLLQMV